jgi:amino acid adenylation domain-containing protein
MYMPSRQEEIRSAERPELLRTKGIGDQSAPGIVPRTTAGPCPLSLAQQRLWLLEQLTPHCSTYNIPVGMRLTGRLNVAALERSVNLIIERHESLRTTFFVVEGQPLQQVAAPGSIQLAAIDLRPLGSAERERMLYRLADEERQRPFDLVHGPLLRTLLLRLADDEHILLLTIHHIVFDAWSEGVLIGELTTLYAAIAADQAASLPDLPIQYADVALWQRDPMQGAIRDGQLAYWRQQLANVLVLDLPTDYPRPDTRSYKGAQQSFHWPAALSAELHALSRREGVTLFTTVLAAFNVLLQRYSGEHDLAVGAPIGGRNRREIEPLIGFCANTLVLRSDLSGNPCFRDLLQRVHDTVLMAYAHQDVPFEQVVEAVQPECDLSRTPLFQVLFALQSAPTTALALPDMQIAPFDVPFAHAGFDLTVSLRDMSSGLRGQIGYNTELFSAATIQRLIGHFEVVLQSIVADPGQHIGMLPLLTEAEHRQILRDWNSTAEAYPAQACIHQCFETQVARTPDVPAVVFTANGEQVAQLSYAELDRRANQLARYVQARGIGPEHCVGICMERSLELIVAILGVLKAGGAYVPLDPAYPADRLQFMLDDSRASVLLTQERLSACLPPHTSQVICLDSQWEAIDQERADPPTSDVTAHNLAYIIYTSGSTGRPKGVQIEHQGVVNLAQAEINMLGVGVGDQVLQFSSFSFDASVFELLMALLSGATLHLASAADLVPGPALRDLLRRRAITSFILTPSTLAVLQHPEGPHDLPALRTIIAGAEECSSELVARWAPADGSNRVFLNAYGPTEVTVVVTIGQCSPNGAKPSIGRPLANKQVYLLNAYGQPVPVGVPGELYIAGIGLARGYLNRPDLTAERFVPDPFSREAGARMYRSGDLARYRPDGQIEFLGRIDHQVKVRGYRIELGEIETALIAHPALREAVVTVREDQPGNKRLVAYIVPRTAQPLTIGEIRADLQKRLPEHMVPTAFVLLDALPRTPSGKLSRTALPAPEDDRSGLAAFVAPRTPLEDLIAGIWADVLGRERVGVEDHFFEIGGHSLLATQALIRLRDACQVDIPLRSLFDAPTVARLAEHIEQSQPIALAQPPLQPRPAEAQDQLPLSFAQQRLWFLSQLAPHSPAYNIAIMMRLTGHLHVAALEDSLNEIVRRHEMLRTTIVVVDEQPIQVIGSPCVIALPWIDLQALTRSEQEARVQQLAIEDSLQPFDLCNGPLVRAQLIRLNEREHILLWSMHHIASDGWSLSVLVRELGALYGSYAAGQPSPLLPLPIQYADYTLWQRAWLQGPVLETQLAYWRQQLHEPLPVLSLPTDRPRPSVQTERGARYTFTIPQDLTGEIVALSRRAGATLFMTLLAAFKVVLARYSGQTDILVGSPIAGRTHTETEALIGFFVNTLVLRTNLRGNPSFRELLQQVREVALSAYAHGETPFEKLVEELQPQRDLSRTPLFQVMFVLHNTPASSLELPDLKLELLEVDRKMTPFDLSLAITETEQGLMGALEYNTDLFDAGTMQRMMDHLVVVLRGIVADPEQPIATIPLLTDAERQQMLSEHATPTAAYPEDVCIHALIAEQAALRPDAVAVVFEDRALTYRELNQYANQLAHYLQQSGVGPETRVGVCMERGVELMIGLLAILKAGGAYVPLDPAYPSERLAFMLDDAQASTILTQRSLLDHVSIDGVQLICLDRDWAEIAQQPTIEPTSTVTAENLAYVIYTSGSTGLPKGAMVQHRSLVAFTLMVSRAYAIDASDRMLQFTSLSWDTSVEEIFPCLAQGAALVLRPTAMLDSMATFVRICQAAGITVLNLPTAVWHMLTASLTQEHLTFPPTIRLVIIGGERALPEHVAAWRLHVGDRARLLNTYGLAEATVEVSMAEVSKAEADVCDMREVSIGRPFDAVRIYLLDTYLQPVPIGIPGEIYVGGGNLARGYLRRPALTAERFMPDPFGMPGARMYRTGDVGRYRADGQLEFVGRVDQQVKIRGHRVELGEIEVALHQHPAVSEAVAMVRAHPSGDAQLLAYVVLHHAEAATSQELRAFMQMQVPGYMVPSAVILLDAFPLTANGKIDSRALPAPDHTRSDEDRAYVPPRTATERQLAEVWQSVLGTPQIGRHDDFFQLGGHSLLATKALSRIGATFALELPLRSLFEYSTLAALAEHIDILQWANQGQLALNMDQPREEGEL